MKKKILIIIVIVFIALLAGFGGYYLKELNIPNHGEYAKEDGIAEKEESTNVDALGLNLFEKFKTSVNDVEYDIYNNDLNYEKLKNSVKLSMAFKNISIDKIEEGTVSDLTCETGYLTNNTDADGYYGYKCWHLKVSKSDFEMSYKELFGNDKSVNYEEFLFDFNVCNLENNEIVCYEYFGGDAVSNVQLVDYTEANLENDELYVYVKLLNINLTNENYLGTQTDKENLFTKYNNDALKYKLTFKKDNIDNWYWFKTEIIN